MFGDNFFFSLLIIFFFLGHIVSLFVFVGVRVTDFSYIKDSKVLVYYAPHPDPKAHRLMASQNEPGLKE